MQNYFPITLHSYKTERKAGAFPPKKIIRNTRTLLIITQKKK